MEYIKNEGLLIANKCKIKVVHSLPASASDKEVVLVIGDGFYQYRNGSFVEILTPGSGTSDGIIGEVRMNVDANFDDDNWLYCDGSTYDTSEYPSLYAFLGTNVLPDFREAHLVGIGENDTDNIAAHDVFTLGQVKDRQIQGHFHSKTETPHKHSVSMASHTHSFSGVAGGTQDGYAGSGVGTNYQSPKRSTYNSSYTAWGVKMGDQVEWDVPLSLYRPINRDNTVSGDTQHLRTSSIGVKYYIRAKI